MNHKIKICCRCEIPKIIDCFSKNKKSKDGLQYYCKECESKDKKQWYKNNFKKKAVYSKQYRENNKEKIAVKKKQYRENNKEKIAIKLKQWRKDNYEKCVATIKQWNEHNYEKVIISQKRRREKKLSTFKGRLNQKMSTSICASLKRQGVSKNGHHWENLVGYKLEELISSLGSQFKDGMNWDNYGHGKNKWCIDHGVPINYFNYDSPEHPEFKVCWGLNNLQPMWCSENFSKGCRL